MGGNSSPPIPQSCLPEFTMPDPASTMTYSSYSFITSEVVLPPKYVNPRLQIGYEPRVPYILIFIEPLVDRQAKHPVNNYITGRSRQTCKLIFWRSTGRFKISMPISGFAENTWRAVTPLA